MKNKALFWVNLLVISLVFILNYFYQKAGFDFYLKCVCSFLFALLGVCNLSYALMAEAANKKFYIAMSVGLVLAFLGDVLIVYNFIIGAAVFALAHVLFIVAYICLQKIKLPDFIVSFAIFAGTTVFLLLYPLFNFGSSAIKIVCVIYAFVISGMLGKAICNFVYQKSSITFIIAFASFLFFFSDFMLVLSRFVSLWSWTNNACMATYYPAVCLLAFSMFLKATSQSQYN